MTEDERIERWLAETIAGLFGDGPDPCPFPAASIMRLIWCEMWEAIDG